MSFQMAKGVMLWRAWVWLCRCKYSRGFGVQSPWAYRFIRYVINEHYPYYAYEALEKKYSMGSCMDVRLASLYFRIANYSRPTRWGFAIEQYDMKADYVQSGCRGTEIIDILNGCEIGSVLQCEVLIMTLESNWKKVFETFAEHASINSILIVENIHGNKNRKVIWKEMQQDERSGITFDLYDCGLIFFDKTMYKQHYIVNF